MKFQDLKIANTTRCIQSFHAVTEWSETDWMTAVAGEVGEAANNIKKRRRKTTNVHIAYVKEPPTVEETVNELADAVIYIDLLCTRMGASLEDGIRRKFNEVSERVGSPIKLND